MQQEELWTEVKGYAGKYQVSTFGRVKTFNDKYVNVSNTADKRLRLRLSIDSKSKVHILKRLVFDSFFPGVKHRVEIRHIDNNYLNCKLNNLYVVRDRKILFNGATDFKLRRIEIPARIKHYVVVDTDSKYIHYAE